MHKRKGSFALPPQLVFGKTENKRRKNMLLIVGLGNPGNPYARTRHNVGFDVIDVLSEKTGIAVKKKMSHTLVGEGNYQGERIVLCKPQTFMNDSGRSVVELVNWYKPEPDRLLVIYDDIDLPLGKLRIRKSGSAGTHNGMRSILAQYGRQDFPRMRVGVGAKPEGWDLADWVLSHYATQEEQKTQFDAFMRAADAALMIARDGVEKAMQSYNQK